MGAEGAVKKGKNKSFLAILICLPFYFYPVPCLSSGIFSTAPKGFYYSVLCTGYHFVKYIKIRELQ